MIITRETEERFVKMLDAKQVIIIRSDKGGSRKTFDFKFIGASSSGKWDFTPLVACYSGYPYTGQNSTTRVRALDGVEVIANTLLKLSAEGIFKKSMRGYTLFEYAREHVATFYI